MIFRKPAVYLAATALIVTAIAAASLLHSRSAGASTAACGSACTSPSVESLGTTDVLTVSGTNVVMAAASSTNTNQDWTTEAQGTVSAAVLDGIVSAKLNLNYSNDTLVEFQYAPGGIPSDQCLANTATVVSSSNEDVQWYEPTLTVVLAQCGITAQSLWIVDQNTLVNSSNSYTDLINAGWETDPGYAETDGEDSPANFTSPFAEPMVLTLDSSTLNSKGDVGLKPLSEIGGAVSAAQMWTAYTAPDQSALRAKIAKTR
jgi:hypothetical protein